MNKVKIPKVRLDWRAYYKRFEEEHGGDPVPYRGRLLFRDGWQYSSTDYMGPEWAPPEDSVELSRLQLAYWFYRLEMVTNERDQLKVHLDGLYDLQVSKSIPLQQVVSRWDEDRRLFIRDNAGDVNLEPLEDRLNWLDSDIHNTRERIKELNGGATQHTRQTRQVQIQ